MSSIVRSSTGVQYAGYLRSWDGEVTKKYWCVLRDGHFLVYPSHINEPLESDEGTFGVEDRPVHKFPIQDLIISASVTQIGSNGQQDCVLELSSSRSDEKISLHTTHVLALQRWVDAVKKASYQGIDASFDSPAGEPLPPALDFNNSYPGAILHGLGPSHQLQQSRKPIKSNTQRTDVSEKAIAESSWPEVNANYKYSNPLNTSLLFSKLSSKEAAKYIRSSSWTQPRDGANTPQSSSGISTPTSIRSSAYKDSADESSVSSSVASSPVVTKPQRDIFDSDSRRIIPKHENQGSSVVSPLGKNSKTRSQMFYTGEKDISALKSTPGMRHVKKRNNTTTLKRHTVSSIPGYADSSLSTNSKEKISTSNDVILPVEAAPGPTRHTIAPISHLDQQIQIRSKLHRQRTHSPVIETSNDEQLDSDSSLESPGRETASLDGERLLPDEDIRSSVPTVKTTGSLPPHTELRNSSTQVKITASELGTIPAVENVAFEGIPSPVHKLKRRLLENTRAPGDSESKSTANGDFGISRNRSGSFGSRLLRRAKSAVGKRNKSLEVEDKNTSSMKSPASDPLPACENNTSDVEKNVNSRASVNGTRVSKPRILMEGPLYRTKIMKWQKYWAVLDSNKTLSFYKNEEQLHSSDPTTHTVVLASGCEVINISQAKNNNIFTLLPLQRKTHVVHQGKSIDGNSASKPVQLMCKSTQEFVHWMKAFVQVNTTTTHSLAENRSLVKLKLRNSAKSIENDTSSDSELLVLPNHMHLHESTRLRILTANMKSSAKWFEIIQFPRSDHELRQRTLLDQEALIIQTRQLPPARTDSSELAGSSNSPTIDGGPESSSHASNNGLAQEQWACAGMKTIETASSLLVPVEAVQYQQWSRTIEACNSVSNRVKLFEDLSSSTDDCSEKSFNKECSSGGQKRYKVSIFRYCFSRYTCVTKLTDTSEKFEPAFSKLRRSKSEGNILEPTSLNPRYRMRTIKSALPELTRIDFIEIYGISPSKGNRSATSSTKDQSQSLSDHDSESDYLARSSVSGISGNKDISDDGYRSSGNTNDHVAPSKQSKESSASEESTKEEKRSSNWFSTFRRSIKSNDDEKSKIGKAATVLKIPASRLSSASHRGYVDRRNKKKQWERFWCVLQDSCLYCYNSPQSDVTRDVVLLRGYDVIADVTNMNRSRFVFRLEQQGAQTLYFGSDNHEEFLLWVGTLEKDTRCVTTPNSRMETENRTTSTSPTHSDVTPVESYNSRSSYKRTASKDELEQELVEMQKHKLLKEIVAQQQQLIEEHRLLEGKVSENSSVNEMSLPRRTSRRNDVIDKFERVRSEEATKMTKFMTLLNRRRNSAQLKVDQLSREIAPKSGKKRRQNHQNFAAYEAKLNEMKQRLAEIDEEIHEQQAQKQSVMEKLQERQDLELLVAEQQESLAIMRRHQNDEFPFTVQRRRKAPREALTSIEELSSISDCCSSSSDSMNEAPARLPHAMSTPRCKRTKQPVSFDSVPSEEFYQCEDDTEPMSASSLDGVIASSSMSSSVSSLTVSRDSLNANNPSESKKSEEIDPSVMAGIEMFEEFTKMKLGKQRE
ncbi:uncharacterized protein LOC100176971 [Ciona intestinalis]